MPSSIAATKPNASAVAAIFQLAASPIVTSRVVASSRT